MNEDDHHKEVYARFGLAVYQAQVLETGLIQALVALDFLPTNASHISEKIDWSQKFDSFYDERAALTMGNLIKALRKLTSVPDDLEEQLRTALEERKFLVHHYFRERIMLFTTKIGRDKMIEDFTRCGKVFIAADRRLEEIVAPIHARFGITLEKIDALVEELKSKSRP